MQPQLIVEQKITPFANKYAVYKAEADGSKGELVAFAQQKRLAFKEQVTFYGDEAKTSPAFTFRAEKVMDIHGRFLVEDPQGKLIGSFKKQFGQSLLKSTWHILDDKDQPQFSVAESSAVLALLRRFIGLVPIIGEFLDLIMAFFRYHFNVTDMANNKVVGKYQKTALWRDHYLLSVDDAAYSQQDWRVFAALSVALDALQGR